MNNEIVFLLDDSYRKLQKVVLQLQEKPGQGVPVKKTEFERNGTTIVQWRDKYGYPAVSPDAKSPQAPGSPVVNSINDSPQTNNEQIKEGTGVKNISSNPAFIALNIAVNDCVDILNKVKDSGKETLDSITKFLTNNELAKFIKDRTFLGAVDNFSAKLKQSIESGDIQSYPKAIATAIAYNVLSQSVHYVASVIAGGIFINSMLGLMGLSALAKKKNTFNEVNKALGKQGKQAYTYRFGTKEMEYDAHWHGFWGTIGVVFSIDKIDRIYARREAESEIAIAEKGNKELQEEVKKILQQAKKDIEKEASPKLAEQAKSMSDADILAILGLPFFGRYLEMPGASEALAKFRTYLLDLSKGKVSPSDKGDIFGKVRQEIVQDMRKIKMEATKNEMDEFIENEADIMKHRYGLSV